VLACTLWGESVESAVWFCFACWVPLLSQTGSWGVGTAVCQEYRRNTRTHIRKYRPRIYIYIFIGILEFGSNIVLSMMHVMHPQLAEHTLLYAYLF
jgi:hypothetical protein